MHTYTYVSVILQHDDGLCAFGITQFFRSQYYLYIHTDTGSRFAVHKFRYIICRQYARRKSTQQWNVRTRPGFVWVRDSFCFWHNVVSEIMPNTRPVNTNLYTRTHEYVLLSVRFRSMVRSTKAVVVLLHRSHKSSNWRRPSRPSQRNPCAFSIVFRLRVCSRASPQFSRYKRFPAGAAGEMLAPCPRVWISKLPSVATVP